ncbi:hypothetical protein M0D21_08145 [Aquimarina sp. D1M17]|uniref:hypothetical protein n=1 Tax=Aquimarina acroporae TaxID=2937283 RepID=UPI0020C0B7D2|nr:hypothetical protein [Aquimarina acroporae]MCK8521535.1 hypothetical protein [Aquimarina acroporae]
MRKFLLIVITVNSLHSIAQKRTQIFFKDYVECYYSDKETKPISIYESPSGKIITELTVLTESLCWYKFAISESNNGWLKIENVIVLPACEGNELNNDIGKYKGKWISSENMKISLPHFTKESGVKINFYENTDKNSNIIFTAIEYLSTELTEVNGTWAKVKFKKNGKLYTGWIERKYQCPYPWTTCPVWN